MSLNENPKYSVKTRFLQFQDREIQVFQEKLQEVRQHCPAIQICMAVAADSGQLISRLFSQIDYIFQQLFAWKIAKVPK